MTGLPPVDQQFELPGLETFALTLDNFIPLVIHLPRK